MSQCDFKPFDAVDYMKVLLFRALANEASREPCKKKIMSENLSEKFNGLREFYRLANKEILEAGRYEWGIDAYEVDWVILFTPIEKALWHDIRDCNAILYPQYPVGRYFVDFGNPVAKVAIECDGAIYHKDKAKDSARQSEIESLGWHVYRISGRDCFTEFNEETMQSGYARQFVSGICENHRIGRHHQTNHK